MNRVVALDRLFWNNRDVALASESFLFLLVCCRTGEAASLPVQDAYLRSTRWTN